MLHIFSFVQGLAVGKDAVPEKQFPECTMMCATFQASAH